jgi:hypothetical protein
MPYGTNGDSWLYMGCDLPTSYICKDHMAMYGTPNWSAGDVYGDEIDCMVPAPVPTKVPTKAPTDAPTKAPTDAPTKAPTDAPTKAPTDAPTKAPTDAPTKAPIKAPTKAPTGAPTAATVALGKAQALSAHADLLNSDPVSALSKYKHALSAFTTVLGVKDLLTQGMAHRVSKMAVANGGSPLSGLDANYPADAFAHQGSCPATVPAFANGVNGAKVVDKGPHGAHDENMSGSIVPVDCADGFTATPEGSNPLVFQRCDAVAGDTSKYEWKPYGTCAIPTLLQNGGFENGAIGSIPEGWSRYRGITGLISTDTAHGGSKSIKFTGGGHGGVWELIENGGVNDQAAEMELEAGKTYVLTFWAYSTTAGQAIRSEFLKYRGTTDAENYAGVIETVCCGDPYVLKHKTTAANTWEKFTHTISVETTQSSRVNLGYAVINGALYLDDVSVDAL